MKKIFALAAIALMSCTAFVEKASAQYDMTSSYGNAKDTITNTSNNTVAIHVTQGWSYIAFQPVVKKISGTLTSNSNAILQGSIDGVNYTSIAADTLHITNTANNVTMFSISAAAGNLYNYFRMSYTGVGTMVATLQCKCLFKTLDTINK